jgi:hypothetical protein
MAAGSLDQAQATQGPAVLDRQVRRGTVFVVLCLDIWPIRSSRSRDRGHSKASVDTNLQVAYFASCLINQKVLADADGHPRQHVCGPRGSHSARDPGAPRFEGRGVRESPNTEPPEQELLITRVFDAPRQLVFEACTEPEHFVRWWGPKEREFANGGARESAGVSK